MDRRAFVAGMAAVVATPPIRNARGAGRLYRIAILGIGNLSYERWKTISTVRAFREGLGQLGYLEGQHFVFDMRSAGGDMQKFYLLLDDMLRLRPDVFFYAVCGGGFHQLRERVKTVPIVVAACNDDLVAKGIVASLGRPGGNITGQSKVTPELASKRLSLAKELVSSARRVAVLWNPYYADFAADWQAIRSTASALNVSLESFPIQTQADLDAAFAAIGRIRADALVTFSDTVVHAAAKQVAELAARYRVPAVYAFREVPDAGGLVSYGPNLNAMFRASARYVVRIFNGGNPGEMPIEQPTRFELVMNLKTAKALGLTIPASLLVRVDHVIE